MPDSDHPEPLLFSRRVLMRATALAGFAPARSVAAIDPAPWRLRVSGKIHAPLTLSRADLRELGEVTVTAVLECGGSGAARNATWTGVPLHAVLDHAGVRGDAVAVVATGGDGHRRTLSIQDVAPAGPLLAWQQDGAALSSPRLLVPGWAGEASVKRIVSLEVAGPVSAEPAAADPFDHRLRPLREMPPRALIVTPAEGEIPLAGRRVIEGVAWSGYAPISSVAVSVDGGATWREAEIVARTGPLGWVRFAAAWAAVPGPALLAARATDGFGLTQPLDVPERARGFVHNAIAVVPVTVR